MPRPACGGRCRGSPSLERRPARRRRPADAPAIALPPCGKTASPCSSRAPSPPARARTCTPAARIEPGRSAPQHPRRQNHEQRSAEHQPQRPSRPPVRRRGAQPQHPLPLRRSPYVAPHFCPFREIRIAAADEAGSAAEMLAAALALPEVSRSLRRRPSSPAHWRR